MLSITVVCLVERLLERQIIFKVFALLYNTQFYCVFQYGSIDWHKNRFSCNHISDKNDLKNVVYRLFCLDSKITNFINYQN